MLKCFICDKDLENGVASATKENGDYYLMCRSCGNVHYVKPLKNGLKEVQRTGNDDSEETMAAMREAAELFKKVGVGVMEFKTGVHSEKKSAKELNKRDLSDKEYDLLKMSYDNLPHPIKAKQTFEEYVDEFIEFRKRMKENPQEEIKKMLDRALSQIAGIDGLFDEEDCDCDCCDNDECENHPDYEEDYEDDYEDECCGCGECSCSDEDEEEPSLEEVFRNTLPVYVVKATDSKGRQVVAEADDKEELAEIISDAEENRITINKVSKVNVTLTPIEMTKEVRYKIND